MARLKVCRQFPYQPFEENTTIRRPFLRICSGIRGLVARHDHFYRRCGLPYLNFLGRIFSYVRLKSRVLEVYIARIKPRERNQSTSHRHVAPISFGSDPR
jgi:hypothetical protein